MGREPSSSSEKPVSNSLFFGPFTFDTRGSLKLAKFCAGAEWARGGWSRGALVEKADFLRSLQLRFHQVETGATEPGYGIAYKQGHAALHVARGASGKFWNPIP